MSVLEVLAKKGVIQNESISSIEEKVRSSGQSIGKVLTSMGVSVAELLEAKGEFYNLPTRILDVPSIPFEILSYISEESVRHYQFVPIGISEGVLEVGVVDPDNIDAKDALQFISTKVNLPFKIFLISQEDFEAVLESYKGLSGEVTKALSELETELSAEERELSKSVEEVSDTTTTTKIIEDAPVTKIVATILRYAIEGNASDIHIEPMGEDVRVRFRVDGVMHKSLTLPMKVHQAVVARIKILANMKLDEKRKPQDNRFSAHIEGRKIDFRVSTFPAYHGEKVVMRILDSEKGVIPLDKMGLSKRNLKAIREAIKKPYGLILISGPTGSGKTTTLYSMLNEIDRDTKNVLSLEDPVEYNIPGMNQSQVRPEIGYTFASGLRTTLRQDPDVIMVGEIRDKETAGLAVQAALTGHLVLSTIHTNNAVGVIPRLIDMEVDPYLIAPTLVIAIAQRLVKTLCPDSGKEVPISGSLKLMIDKQFEDLSPEYRDEIPQAKSVYEADPTPDCPTGTKGRVAVFEVLKMDSDIEHVVLENPTESSLVEVSRGQGMLTMREDALIKAFKKEIPFGEVNTLGGFNKKSSKEEVET